MLRAFLIKDWDDERMAKRRSTLGAVIRQLRDSNGWTLREMSERTGIPVSTLSKVEHNRLTLTYDKLQELSVRLNIRMADLFVESEAAPEAAQVTARRSIGRHARKCVPRADRELRLLLSLHRIAPQADDPEHHDDPCADAR